MWQTPQSSDCHCCPCQMLKISKLRHFQQFPLAVTSSTFLALSLFPTFPSKYLNIWLILQPRAGSPGTCGHSRMNWRYHSLTSSTRNLVLVTRNSTSSSVREAFRARVFSRLAFHRSLDFMQLRTVPKPATVDSIGTNIKYHQNIDSWYQIPTLGHNI